MIKLKLFKQKVEWYDIKTKAKKMLRSLLYTYFIQEFISSFIFCYMWFVFLSSKKKFINSQQFLNVTNSSKPLIVCCWHNRLMIMPFVANHANKNYKFMALASSHGDGQFVGRVMAKFGFHNIYGSSKNGRKASRGIDMHSLREIIRGLKNNKGLAITPDGPRGPNQKINSEVINIAKLSKAMIIPASATCSRSIKFNSWDKFKMPLPFSKICFYFGDLIIVDNNITKEDEVRLRKELEEKLNDAQEKSQKFNNVE